MAIQGAFKVDCGDMFPHGVCVVSEVKPLADFNASTKDNPVQQLGTRRLGCRCGRSRCWTSTSRPGRRPIG